MASLPDDPAREPRIALSELNFGTYPMVNGQSRLARRFYEESGPLDAARARDRQRRSRRRRPSGSGSSRPRPTISTGPTKSASRWKSARACRRTR